MSILTRYLSFHILKNILSVLTLLTVVFSIFSVLAELEIVTEAEGIKLIPIFWLIESLLLGYKLIPFAVLIGSVLGLSSFVSTNQLLVMQISGFTARYRRNSIIIVGSTIFVITFVVGEIVVPVAKKLKAEIQLSIGETRDFTLTDKGFWARNQNVFFKVDTLQGKNIVKGIELYEFDDGMELQSILTADSGTHNGLIWIFEGVSVLTFKPKYSAKKYDSSFEKQLTIGPEIMEMVVNEQKDQSIFSLLAYLKLAEVTGQITDELYFTIFQKISYWIDIFVLLVLSYFLVRIRLERFSSSRNIITGICIGFGYFVIGRILNQAGLVFSLSPGLVAFMPSMLLLIIIYILKLRSN